MTSTYNYLKKRKAAKLISHNKAFYEENAFFPISSPQLKKLMTAWIFYRKLPKFVQKDFPSDYRHFRIIPSDSCHGINSMRENYRFLLGMGEWVAFAKLPINSRRAASSAGDAMDANSKKLNVVGKATLSFSPLTIQLTFLLGIAAAFVWGIFGIHSVVLPSLQFMSYNPTLYNLSCSAIVNLFCIIGGTLLISLATLEEFIDKIFSIIKLRPLYVVKIRKNST